jgi:hypothetical protein
MDGFTVVRKASEGVPSGFTVVRKAPARKPKRGERRGVAEEVSGFLANLNRGLMVGDEFAAGLSTAADLVTGKVKPRVAPGQNALGMSPVLTGIGDSFRENMRGQRQMEDEFTARRPLVAGSARGLGNSASLIAPGAQLAAAPNALVGAVRAGTVAAGQGYVAGLTDRGTPGERSRAATTNAMIAAPLGAVLPGASALASRVRRPRPLDPNVATLAREGVTMTPGQMRGGLAKSFEDAATSVPILGDSIQRARREGMESFTRAPINRALREIDDDLPQGMTGNEAIEFAQERFSQGYNDVLPTAGVRADEGFATEVAESLGPITQTLRPESRAQLQNIIESRVQSRIPEDGVMTGEVYQRVQSELKNEISRFTGSTDPDARAVGDALRAVLASLESAAARQNPEFATALSGLNRGYSQLVRAETAAARTGAEGGVFTPAQYDAAVRAGDGTVRRRGYAAGNALGQDLADAGRAVLPSSLPDSGTARRGMVGVVLGGGAGVVGGLPGLIATAGGLAAASRIYSPRAIELANRALQERVTREEAGQILQELEALAATNPRVRELQAVITERLARATGALTNTAQSPNAMQPLPAQ